MEPPAMPWLTKPAKPPPLAGRKPAVLRLRGPPGSECCVAVGDGGREAYTAVVWGVGMSHERHNVVGDETVGSVEGNMCGTVTRGADALPGSMAHHARKDRVGTWEIPRSTGAAQPPR